jgi:hypothetical protein
MVFAYEKTEKSNPYYTRLLPLEEKTAVDNFTEIRSELRTILDKYYSVQFSLSKMDPAYLFKLRNISGNGLCILVKQDSSAFKQLNVGDILNMEYNPAESSDPTKLLKTQITSKNCYDRFKGHSLVELKVLTDVDSHCGGISYDL